jgi:hypothetical protein
MALSILQTIQKNLGLTELKKVDPNMQEIKPPQKTPKNNLTRQPFPQF